MKIEDLKAVLVIDSESLSATTRRVAGLPLLKRNLVALSRAGFRRVSIWGRVRPAKLSRWAAGTDVELDMASPTTAVLGPWLICSADLALQPDLIEELVVNWDGRRISAFWTSEDEEPSLILIPGSLVPVDDWATLLDRLGDSPLRMQITSPALRIRDRRTARIFHRRLEAFMVKESDGLFAQWNRKISIPLSRVLALFPVSPNMVTYFTLAIAAWGAYFLALGGYWMMLLGAGLTQVSSILDGNDGELARLKLMESDFGTWLDTICDYISYFLTFGGIAFGLYRHNGDELYLILGAAFFAGSILSMVLTSQLRRRVADVKGAGALTSVISRYLAEQEDDPGSWASARLRHFGTRAVFTYFLLLFGLLNLWPVVLVVAAIGSHLFWMAILYNRRFLRTLAG